LAAEYIKLAQLEKDSNIANDHEQRSRVLVDAGKAISVLQQLPEGIQASPEVRKQITEALALRQSVL
jgi:hypothetical protein